MAQHKRDLLKALTYRLFGTLGSAGAAWLISRDVKLSLGVLAIDGFGKIALYYVHERIWNRINWGNSQSLS